MNPICQIIVWVGSYILLPFLVSMYASVVVSRIYQFYDTKKDAWEKVICMEGRINPESTTLHHPWVSAALNNPAQRMRYFGHNAAAKVIDHVDSEIESVLNRAKVAFEDDGCKFVDLPRSEWERRLVAITFSLRVFKPWPVMKF